MKKKQIQPIGIFDSGLGGLSIWQECRKLMPWQDCIYVADSAHCPYGNKTPEEITAFSDRITAFLVKQGVSVIVVACNTATTAAISLLRKRYSLPFVGVEPAVKPAAAASETGVIGVLATRRTIRSEFYNHTKEKFAHGVTVHAVAGDGLVEAVEAGETHADETGKLLKQYIDPLLEAGADQLVLGCTHYPFLIEKINEITRGRITVINPAPAVASRVYNLLYGNAQHQEQGSGTDTFYTSGSPAAMSSFLSAVTGENYTVCRFLDETVSSSCP